MASEKKYYTVLVNLPVVEPTLRTSFDVEAMVKNDFQLTYGELRPRRFIHGVTDTIDVPIKFVRRDGSITDAVLTCYRTSAYNNPLVVHAVYMFQVIFQLEEGTKLYYIIRMLDRKFRFVNLLGFDNVGGFFDNHPFQTLKECTTEVSAEELEYYEAEFNYFIKTIGGFVKLTAEQCNAHVLREQIERLKIMELEICKLYERVHKEHPAISHHVQTHIHGIGRRLKYMNIERSQELTGSSAATQDLLFAADANVNFIGSMMASQLAVTSSSDETVDAKRPRLADDN
jgi:hypothetical protein